MIKSNITQVIKNIDKRMNNVESNVSDIEDDAIDYIVGEAKKLAPVRTGNLRRGIIKRTSDNDSYVIATASYSAYVEYGTVKTRPQPFMLPALELGKIYIREALRRGILD